MTLFSQVCTALEKLKQYDYNTETNQIKGTYRFGISRKDALKTPENRKILIDAIRYCGRDHTFMPSISQTANRQADSYNETGWKYVEEFLDSQRIDGGKLFSVIIELGERQLRSKKTAELGRKLAVKLAGKHKTYYTIERMDSRESLVHVHLLMLLPDSYSFPAEVISGRGKYAVKYIELGSQPQYKHKTAYKNARDFFYYLLKPNDARTHKGKGKGIYYKAFWYEWFSNELRKSEGKPPLWERVTLRGSINLNIKWLELFDREEIESRYDETPIQDVTCILHGSTPTRQPKTHAPHSLIPIPTQTKTQTIPLAVPDSFSIYSDIPP